MLGEITTTSSAVNVTATAGAITDITNAETANITASGTATLVAATGIGSAGGAADIDTAIGTLVATNNTSGNIVVQESNGNVAIVNTCAIGNSPAAVMNVAGNTSLTTLGGALNGINIGNATSDTFNTGTLTFNSAGAVNITEDSNMLVTGINTAGTLVLQTPADMDSVSGATIMVTGTTVRLLAGGTIGGLELGELAKTTLAGVGYNSFGFITANNANIVVQAGGVTNGVSVDIVGASINGLLTLTPPNVPRAAVLFNGLSQTSAPFITGLSPMAGVAEALVAAHATHLTGNGGMLPPAPQSTADVFMATAFPTANVREQITADVGTVGLLSPLIKLQGIGVNVSAELASTFQRQEDNEKRRRAAAVPAKP